MARNRFESLEPERQEALLQAAAHEFAERGYGGASLSRITDAAGVSKGLLYYYFNDKEDLFASTVDRALERLLEAVGGFSIEGLSAATYWDELRRLGLESMEMRSRDTWYARLLLAFPRLRSEPEARDAVRPALGWARRFTEHLLARGQALGTVRQDLPLDLLVEVTLAVDEAGDRWLATHHAEHDPQTLRSLVEGRIDLVRDMLDAAHEGWNR
jgi:AcrR family transcriptional regulator